MEPEILRTLAERGHELRAMVRTAPKQEDRFPKRLELAIADLDGAERLKRALAGVDRASSSKHRLSSTMACRTAGSEIPKDRLARAIPTGRRGTRVAHQQAQALAAVSKRPSNTCAPS